jgi:transposase
MAPNLAESQHALIHDMIVSGTLSTAQMANVAGCSKRSIKSIRSNMRYFGSTRAPPNGAGRRRSVTPLMLQALQEYLLETPGQTLDEMTLFPWDEFRVVISPMSISMALKSIGW